MDVDLLIYNGKCISFDEEKVFDWLAVKDGLIVDMGTADCYKNRLTRYNDSIDAKGGSVLPGFYDSNIHLMQTAFNQTRLSLREARSFSDIGDLIKEEMKQHDDGSPIIGYGLDESKLKEKKLPNRHVLDQFCRDLPVMLSRVEYHTSVLNTYGLLHYKISYTLDGIEMGEDKMPTGIVRYSANAKLREEILSDIPVSARKHALDLSTKELLRNGITTVNAMEGGYTFSDWDAEFIYMYKDLVPIDVLLFYQTTDVEMVKAKGLKRIGGSLFVDGAFGSRNAALAEAYSDRPGWKGNLYYSDDEMKGFVLACYENELQLSVHAIGERAIQQMLAAHKYAVQKTGKTGMRHRLEHAELITLEQIAEAKKLELVLSMQPAYEYYWGGPGNMYETRVGARYKKTNPFKGINDAGIIICGGSDSDVTPACPLIGIHAAVNHPTKAHRTDKMTAIKMFTQNGAFAVHEEDHKGTLTKGYDADIVILDRDLLSEKDERILECKVRYTIKNGNVLYSNTTEG